MDADWSSVIACPSLAGWGTARARYVLRLG